MVVATVVDSTGETRTGSASLPIGFRSLSLRLSSNPWLEVGKEQLLIGVTAGGITTLHTLPEPLVVAPAPALPNFAELLAKRLRKEP